MGKLPDADDGARDEEAVNEGLKKTAFFFFRTNEQSVSRFPSWVEGFVCFHKVALSNAMPVPRAKTKFQIARVKRLTNDPQFCEARKLFRRRDQGVPILGRRAARKTLSSRVWRSAPRDLAVVDPASAKNHASRADKAKSYAVRLSVREVPRRASPASG